LASVCGDDADGFDHVAVPYARGAVPGWLIILHVFQPLEAFVVQGQHFLCDEASRGNIVSPAKVFAIEARRVVRAAPQLQAPCCRRRLGLAERLAVPVATRVVWMVCTALYAPRASGEMAGRVHQQQHHRHRRTPDATR
jgi:hypothetical protein